MKLSVIYPLEGEVTEARLNEEVLPLGFNAVKRDGCNFRVQDDNSNYVGSISVEESGLTISFLLGESDFGKNFFRAFGIMHPDYSPNQVLWGIVYRDAKTNLYKLKNIPSPLLSVVLEDARSCGTNEAYFVQFVRGQWLKDKLIVKTKQKIVPGGQLLADSGPVTINLS